MTRVRYATQTQLGEIVGISAVQFGKLLTKAGIREGNKPTSEALENGLAQLRRMANGTEFYVWNQEVISLLQKCEILSEPSLFDDFVSNPKSNKHPLSTIPTASSESSGVNEVLEDVSVSTASSSVEYTNQPVQITSGKSVQRLVVATDGACLGNPGPGGWAWVNQSLGTEDHGGSRNSTNNIMEITAVIQALKSHKEDVELLIRCDSQYVINVATKWAKGWARKNWRNATGKPVANKELIQELMYLLSIRRAKVSWEWVRGHNGDPGNERADYLASSEAARFQAL